MCKCASEMHCLTENGKGMQNGKENVGTPLFSSGSSTIFFPESSFCLTNGPKMRALGATISGVRHRCRLHSETGLAEFSYFKMVAPRALVFRPLVKGNKDSRNKNGPLTFG